jgi:hypothetical protein
LHLITLINTSTAKKVIVSALVFYGCSRGFFATLIFEQFVIVSFIFEECFVRSHFCNSPIVEYDDEIELEIRINAVGNDDSGFFLQISIEIAEDLLFGLGVHSREAVVEDEDIRLFDECPGDGNPLFLSP